MKSSFRIAIVVALGVFLSRNVVCADIVFTTSTSDSASFDFDGAGMETDGSLVTTQRVFTLSGSDIPASFVDVDSIEVTFTANWHLSARATGSSPGIGISSDSDSNFEETTHFDTANFEHLDIDISFVSSNPLQDIQLSGISFSSFGEVGNAVGQLTGATVNNGQTQFSSLDVGTDPLMIFDNNVSNFRIESAGSDSFRMSGVRLSAAVTAVPEPCGLGLPLIGVLGIVYRRKRKTCLTA